MTVFVTVGTTSFDALIEEVNKPIFHYALYCIGYRNLFVQFGNGSVVPKSIPLVDLQEVTVHFPLPPDFEIEPLKLHSFRFSNSLSDFLSHAQLIISHGGAGTCLEALTPPGMRKLVIVINESLMHNHQEELACALLEGRHAFVTTPSHIISLITGEEKANESYQVRSLQDLTRLLGPKSSPESAGLLPFYHGDKSGILRFINEQLGLVPEAS